MPIEVKNLTHVFGAGTPNAFTAVEDVSLTINDGEFVAIIGHTGSGKSTFIQHLNALLQPTSGSVLVDGMDCADKKLRREIRRRVGMVFQYPEYQLVEETVEKDIEFGPKNLGFPPEKLSGCAKAAMERVGLDPEKFAPLSPFELSGGEKRKVAIAGMIAAEPETLVLDEPMAGLDPAGRNEIIELLRELNAGGMTIIIVSHDMDGVCDAAGRVIVFNSGKMELDGTVREVFGQCQRLQEMGLDIPAAARVAQKLRSRGMELPEDILTLAELCSAVEKARCK